MSVYATIPVYVEEIRSSHEDSTLPTTVQYQVAPLFFPQFQSRSIRLAEALRQLKSNLFHYQQAMREHGRSAALANWTCLPIIETKVRRIKIQTRKATARLKLLLVRISLGDQEIAFTPKIPEIWLDIKRGENLVDRFEEILSDHFDKRIADGKQIDWNQYTVQGEAWLTDIRMTITTLPKLQDPNECQRASLESGTVRDGEWELFTVGYSLSDLYPQRLDRPILRSTEVQELTRLLTSEKKSPVLLLGPRKVGKTAVIHGAVFNIEHKKSKRHEEYEQVWLLEPQRLISGMSYVGEWERRFQAIVNHAQRYNLTLYFDDLLGLLQAGVSSSSSLSVASLLRPVIEQRRVRVLAEMHPESFRVLRERDRGLADLFHLLPISELSEVDNLHVLIKRQCELEETYQCQMNLDVLPLVIDLQRRFARETAFPGKAASFLQRLTHQSVDKIREQMTRADGPKTVDILGFTLPRPATITRQHVMDRFQEETGLPEAFFDQNQPLSAAAIQQGLSARFVGQRHVLQAGCEIISLAKARLNDPSRPLASLFLLGPTGVGKTEFARSLATYLFGHADRLIRFDMNEYVSPTAVPQLVGTFEQPNGLLTAAIRRQPFAVLLFDEIEKAHPAVYDLLLQILGEGRLTDAFGRTSDFSHAIIVMTSNLGTRRAELGVGFSPSDALTDFAALSAVRSFFRPEFLNRLDRILPFQALSRSDLESIAEHLLRDFCQRDGIARRRCIVQLQPPAVDWILQQGHHPALGARALKRAIERELTQPLARYLAQHPVTSAAHSALAGATAAVTSTAPAEASTTVNNDHALSSSTPQELLVVEVDRARHVLDNTHDLAVQVRSIRAQEPEAGTLGSLPAIPAAEQLRQAEKTLRRLETELPQLRVAEPIRGSGISPAQARYFHIQEELNRLRSWLDDVQEELADAARLQAPSPAQLKFRRPTEKKNSRVKPTSKFLVTQKLLRRDQFESQTNKLSPGLQAKVDAAVAPVRIRSELAWLQALGAASLEQLSEHETLWLQPVNHVPENWLEWLVEQLLVVWNDAGLEARRSSLPAPENASICVEVSGPLACLWTKVESGYHSFERHASSLPLVLSIQRASQPTSERLVRTYVWDRDSFRNAGEVLQQIREQFFQSLPAPVECFDLPNP